MYIACYHSGRGCSCRLIKLHRHSGRLYSSCLYTLHAIIIGQSLIVCLLVYLIVFNILDLIWAQPHVPRKKWTYFQQIELLTDNNNDV